MKLYCVTQCIYVQNELYLSYVYVNVVCMYVQYVCIYVCVCMSCLYMWIYGKGINTSVQEKFKALSPKYYGISAYVLADFCLMQLDIAMQ